jgi:hypothetical protein
MTIQADQVADAFSAVPGLRVEATQVAVGDAITGSAWTEIFSQTMLISAAGLYRVDLSFTSYASAFSSNGEFEFKVVFDEGGADEVTVGTGGAWKWRQDNMVTYKQHDFLGYGELAAKSQNVKVYGRRNSGSVTLNIAGNQDTRVLASMLSGSGAGGVLVENYIIPSPVAVSDAWTEIASITLDTIDENVLVSFAGWKDGSHEPSGYRLLVDGTEVPDTGLNDRLISSSQTWGVNVSFSTWVSLEAGPHTIAFEGKAMTGGESHTIQDGGRFAVARFRGGQVPWEKDGVQVADTPRAINIVGGAVTAEEDTGKINVTLPEAVTAAGERLVALNDEPSGTISTSSATHVDMDANLAGTVSIPQKGRYRLRVEGQVRASAFTGYLFSRFRVGFDVGGAEEQFIGGSDNPSEYGWDKIIDIADSWDDVRFEDEVTFASDGDHTFKIQWARPITGGGGQLENNNAINWKLILEPITGSGAGGILVETSVLSADQGFNSSPGYTYIDIPTFDSITVETFENERVLVNFHGNIGNAGGARDVLVELYIDDVVVSGERTRKNVAPSWQDSLDLDFFTDPLSEGSHTFKVKIANAGTGTTTLFEGANMAVTRFRGGLTPITDGTTTVQKPIAQEYRNAEVEDSGGKAIITLPKAVVTEGDVVRITEGQRTNTLTLAVGSYTLVAPESGEFTFETLQSGVYLARLSLAVLMPTPAENATCQFRLTFDEGSGNEQTVGDTDDWLARPTVSGEYAYVTMEAEVTLSAGSHTLKVYGSTLSGATNGNRLIGSATVTAPGPIVWLQSISGSGAGGTLLAEAVLAADQEVTDTNNPPTVALPNLDSLTIDCVPGEIIDLRASGPGWSSGGATAPLARFAVDGTPLQTTNAFAVSLGSGLAAQVTFQETFVATATQHVITLLAAVGGPAFTFYSNFTISAWQVRGGLVPWKQDGSQIHDKPHAINLLGPGLQATNVDGQVNVSVQSAAEGVEGYTNTPSDILITTEVTGDNWQVVDSVTFDLVEGERVIAMMTGRGDPSGTGSMYTSIYDSVDGERFAFQMVSSSSGNLRNISISGISPPLSAGTHTIQFRAAYNGAQWNLEQPVFSAAVFRGGYVVPENVPQLAYNSASVVNVAPKAGAADRLWVLLNDGQRYYADGTLTVNLGTTGLGGREASSDPEAADAWYYIYAVPSATSGVFDVIASVNDPDTGPADYSIWKYLGPVRNASGNIRLFTQYGNRFRYREEDIAYNNTTPPTSWTALDLSEWLPATSTSARLSVLLVYTNVNTGQYVWFRRTGDTNSSRRLFWDINAGAILGNRQETDIETDANQSIDHYWQRNETFSACHYRIHEFEDNWLRESQSQLQAKYTPDTPPPKGTWVDATQVDFAAWPGHGSTMRLALSDGKTRFASGTIAVDTDNGVADAGYDHADSQGISKWLYFYAAPKTGDDDQFTIVISDNPPDTGPQGRSAHKYLWSTYIDGSGDLMLVRQPAPWLFHRFPRHTITVGPGIDASPVLQDISSYVPESAGSAVMRGQVTGTSGTFYARVWVSGDESDIAKQIMTPLAGIPSGNGYGIDRTDIPLPNGREIYYQRQGAGLTQLDLAIQGWIDKYLAADAGIGAVAGAGGGTSSPLTTKGDVWGYSTVDDRVPVGSNGQVFEADDTQGLGVKWAAKFPFTTKGDLVVRNDSGQDVRLPAGTNGDVLTADDTEALGVKYATPASGGATPHEESFSTAGTETPGDTVTFGPLSATPRGAGSADTLSGYDLYVYRNGVKMKYAASLTTYNEFFYDVANNEIDVLASGDADEYEVVYGE